MFRIYSFKRKFHLPYGKIIVRGFTNGLRLHSSLLSEVSKTGFNNYEEECRSFRFSVPEKFNFARDVLDVWAQKEVEGRRKSSIPAFWFMWNDGKHIKWDFRELAENSKRTANLLRNSCDLNRGDTFMVVLPKLPEYWLLKIAAIRAGIVLSPGNAQLTSKDLKYRFQALKPKCIITDETLVDAVDEAAKDYPLLKTKMVVSKSKNTKPEWLNFQQAYEHSSADHEVADTASSETMMVFFTSGTTGLPKMVEHSHASYGMSLRFTGRYYMDLTAEDVSWNFSDTGWAKTAYGSFFAPWSMGACVFIHQMQRFDASTMIQVLSEIPVTCLCAPPTVYRMLVKDDALKKASFCALSHCIGGGEPLNPEVVKTWMETTNLRIYQGYGQTETVMMIAQFKCLKYIPGSMGKPAPGSEIVIIDENGNELGPNKEGEIAVKRTSAKVAGLFKGYKDDPEKTSARFIGDYYRTGDLAFYDEDGYFWFVSRNDDIISSAAYRIGPFEVESALIEHPSVVEAAVTSSPDELRGEIVAAFVVLRKEYAQADKDALAKELQEHVKKVTAPYKYPRKITFLEELPKTISGKIRRAELRRKEWEGFV